MRGGGGGYGYFLELGLVILYNVPDCMRIT